jgi:hypothetical protein
MDNCPHVFNPIRPVDNGVQGDLDGDSVGDACDPCPLDANTTSCTVVDPNDRDHDGIPNATDNCPDTANPDQKDTDGDGKGDVCDACPNAANPGAAGCPATIYDIKTGVVPVGTAVEVSNVIVTGKGTNGFFVQVKEGDTAYTGPDNSGLFVFAGTASPLLANAVVGTRVTIDGSVDNFQGQLELDGLSAVTVINPTVEAAPAPIAVTYTEIKTGGTRAATLESVIVSLGAAAVSAVNATAGEFTLTSGADTLIVDDFLLTFTNPPLNQNFLSVAGVLNLRNSASKLEPRSAADLVLGAPGLAAFGPATSFIRTGTTGSTFPVGSELTVTLSGKAQGDTFVTVVSGSTDLVVVGGGVTVLDNATTAKVQLQGVNANADVTLMASLGTTMLSAHVRVLGAAEVPTTVVLTPADAAVAPGGTVLYTVTLDLPADVAETINLSVNPTVAGNLPATVTIGVNQIAATFTYTDVATDGSATVTATFGASSSNSTVTVSTGANHLVINEVDYDNVGTDTAEFVEIYNPSPTAQSLAHKSLLLVNGANSQVYDTVDLSLAPGGSVPAHGYLVIAGANVTVMAPAIKLDPGWTQDAIQNGAPDGLALVDTQTLTVVDAFSYEGSILLAQLTGFANPVSLVEGTALGSTIADTNTAPSGALCRFPDGQDTDNASVDWKLCAAPTPGTANQ